MGTACFTTNPIVEHNFCWFFETYVTIIMSSDNMPALSSDLTVFVRYQPQPSPLFGLILLSQTSSHCAVNWYATEADEQRLPREYRTNAEECRDYRERLKAEDPAKDGERRQKNHANAKEWRDSLGPSQSKVIRFPSRKSKSTRRKPAVCSNFDLVASSPQDDHLDSVASSPQDDHLDSVASSPQDDHLDSVASSPQDDHLDSVASSPQDDHLDSVASSPQDDHLDSVASSPQDDHLDSVASSPQDDHLDSVASSPREVHLDDRDSFFWLMTVQNCQSVILRKLCKLLPLSLSLYCRSFQFLRLQLRLYLRCRIVLELAELVQEYNSSDGTTSQVACETSNHYCDTVYDTFIQEFLEVKSLGTFMGVWQLMAAVNVFGAKVTSVYPDKGIPCHKRLLVECWRPE
ncbi:hypothetical protein RRG08_016921 [Elysia crispata]|uniref:Uncharacterized protein n=1 Tax=Elysia crispata TaxID=231223 RepID=A0AAE0ZL71_9GAST|nr:hypothetical protein RRG08_016921 [Elysia crispata]